MTDHKNPDRGSSSPSDSTRSRREQDAESQPNQQSDPRDPSRHGRSDEPRSHGRHRRSRHDRKGRVLHTRVSEQLSDDIRRFADDLRVPASNLVRNVLEEVFTMVESVSDDVGGVFDEILDEARGARDRIRRHSQETSRSRRRTRDSTGDPHRRRRRGSAREQADEVERELREDEEHEARFDAASSRSEGGAPASAFTASASGADSEPARPDEPRVVPEFPDVIGWQPLVLNRTTACASCHVDLPRGSHAYIGLAAAGLTQTTLCRACTGMG